MQARDCLDSKRCPPLGPLDYVSNLKQISLYQFRIKIKDNKLWRFNVKVARKQIELEVSDLWKWADKIQWKLWLQVRASWKWWRPLGICLHICRWRTGWECSEELKIYFFSKSLNSILTYQHKSQALFSNNSPGFVNCPNWVDSCCWKSD